MSELDVTMTWEKRARYLEQELEKALEQRSEYMRLYEQAVHDNIQLRQELSSAADVVVKLSQLCQRKARWSAAWKCAATRYRGLANDHV